uniref:Uncharacterized protein n=1 Tax=Arundo donax TaxID=35708 RepID=A0A0A8YXR8_ARUDO
MQSAGLWLLLTGKRITR